MIDGSKESKCQLASELQDLRVFEKRSKEEVTQSKNAIEDQNRICDQYIILSNGPLLCKKKIQFTATNTFYFFVILHMHPCLHSVTVHHV